MSVNEKIGYLRDELASIPGVFWDGDKGEPPSGQITRVSSSLAAIAKSSSPALEEEYEGVEEDKKRIYERIGQSVSKEGIDALGFYSSFHLNGSAFDLSRDWGIFIKESSLYYLAYRLFDDIDGKNENLDFAYRLILYHELFHYWTDIEIARLELISKKPLWRFDQWLRGTRKSHSFKQFKKYWDMEECAANASMLRMLASRHDKLPDEGIKRFVESQPSGYRDAYGFTGDSSYKALTQKLMDYKYGVLGYKANSSVISAAFRLFSPDWAAGGNEFPDPPIFLLRDERSGIYRDIVEELIPSIQIDEETKTFKKAYKRLHPNLQKKWLRKKTELASRVPPYPEFEKMNGLGGSVYSIRLNSNYRAHLRHERQEKKWYAIGIGTHTKMGHD